jgi:hypothetical protein
MCINKLLVTVPRQSGGAAGGRGTDHVCAHVQRQGHSVWRAARVPRRVGRREDQMRGCHNDAQQ